MANIVANRLSNSIASTAMVALMNFSFPQANGLIERAPSVAIPTMPQRRRYSTANAIVSVFSLPFDAFDIMPDYASLGLYSTDAIPEISITPDFMGFVLESPQLAGAYLQEYGDLK